MSKYVKNLVSDELASRLDGVDEALARALESDHEDLRERAATALAKWGPPLDFTNPEARAWWQDQLQPYVDLGVVGYKLDYGEEVIVGVTRFRPADPDKVDILRQENRHLGFGGGIHRCLGSNLGRRELVVGIEEFLKVVPPFKPANPEQKWHGVGPLNIAF